MRILWAFEVKPSEDAKLPLDDLEWRGTFPGLPGPDMPVTLTPRDGQRLGVLERLMKEANAARPAMVCTT